MATKCSITGFLKSKVILNNYGLCVGHPVGCQRDEVLNLHPFAQVHLIAEVGSPVSFPEGQLCWQSLWGFGHWPRFPPPSQAASVALQDRTNVSRSFYVTGNVENAVWTQGCHGWRGTEGARCHRCLTDVSDNRHTCPEFNIFIQTVCPSVKFSLSSSLSHCVFIMQRNSSYLTWIRTALIRCLVNQGLGFLALYQNGLRERRWWGGDTPSYFSRLEVNYIGEDTGQMNPQKLKRTIPTMAQL